MNGWWVFLIIVVILAFVAGIGVLVYFWIMRGGSGTEPCEGAKADAGLCCVSQFTKSDYDNVKSYSTTSNIPTNIAGDESLRTDSSRFMVSLYQRILDNASLPFPSGATTDIFHNGIRLGNLFVNGNNAYLIIHQIKTFNECKELKTADFNLTTFPTLEVTAPLYIKEAGDKLITEIDKIVLGREISNFHIFTVNDSFLAGRMVLASIRRLNYHHTSIGDVATMTPATVFGNTNVAVYDNDPYLTALSHSPQALYTLTTRMPNISVTYPCLGDYHQTPYYIQYFPKT